jgi:hypothetical protein
MVVAEIIFFILLFIYYIYLGVAYSFQLFPFQRYTVPVNNDVFSQPYGKHVIPGKVVLTGQPLTLKGLLDGLPNPAAYQFECSKKDASGKCLDIDGNPVTTAN